MNTANPNLPADVGEAYVQDHILTLKAVIDAQKAGDQMAVSSNLRTAYGHMQMLANPLTDAIVKQFPVKFGVAAATTIPAETHTMPTTGMAMAQSTANNTTRGAIFAADLLTVGGIFLLRRARTTKN